MLFFNQKEQVLDFQFTDYGKQKLSVGKFKPAYYAFLDDDILYDVKYGHVSSEVQNNSQIRIKEETPRLMFSPVTKYGVETKLKKNLDFIENTIDSNFMGSSKLSSDKYPAWRISTLDSSISVNNIEHVIAEVSGSYVKSRPQVNFNVIEYNIFVEKAETTETQEPSTFDMQYSNIGPEDDVPFTDGTFFKIQKDHFLIDVSEENVEYGNENFEIEVFLEELDRNNEVILRPLHFIKKRNNIINNILLDEDELTPGEEITINSDYVEYFFDVNVDLEIDTEILCQIKEIQNDNFYLANLFDCERFKAIVPKNLYDTDILDGDSSICD